MIDRDILKIFEDFADNRSIVTDIQLNDRKRPQSAHVNIAPTHVKVSFVQENNGLFITGQFGDGKAAPARIEVKGAVWSTAVEGRHIGRVSRPDAETGLAAFWSLAPSQARPADGEACGATFHLADGSVAVAELTVRRVTLAEVREGLGRMLAGLRPGEVTLPEDMATVQRLLRAPPPPVVRPMPRHTIEAVAVADGGGVFITGWINDTADEIGEIRVESTGWHVALAGNTLSRTMRDDVQSALGIQRRHAFGFWGLAANPAVDAAAPTCVCEIAMRGGAVERHDVPIRVMFDQVELRNLALTYVSTSKYPGNAYLDSVACLERSIGRQIVDLNCLVSNAITARPYVERFGPAAAGRKGSIIVCLYGRAEYLMLQAALFSRRPGIEEYEFIYVSNSPEIAETLLRDAHVAASTYGLAITLVLLPGNAGFGAANNAASETARTDRLLFVNPDVFPLDRDWAAKHVEAVENLPSGQIRIFGVPLYYDDGSLMHAGMYFDGDAMVAIDRSTFSRTLTLRVEHYGKGAPPLTAAFLKPRPVPAVTGAFISADRAWYEKLGGFTEDYVLGHYEDADLCLKSLEAGVSPWLQDIKLWHLEGKGSARRTPVHEGASIVNRWLFNSRWRDLILPDLYGPRPRHALLNTNPSEPAGLHAAAAGRAAAAPTVEIVTNAARAKNEKPAKAPRRPPSGRPLTAGDGELVFATE